jgi:hypothetical protein
MVSFRRRDQCRPEPSVFGDWKAVEKDSGRMSIFRLWEDKGKLVGKMIKVFPKNGGTQAMMIVRMLFLIGCGAVAAACAEPGVTSCTPVSAAGSHSTSPSPTNAGSGGNSGGSMSEELEPCPESFMCTDFSTIGATAMDGEGSEIKASCGMGALVKCDDTDPVGSCPGLTKPICLHISVAGMNLVGCGQACNP